MTILKQIQCDLLSPSVSLADTLRKAKVLARELNSKDLEKWVTQELTGYKLESELPDYRIITTGIIGTCSNGFWVNKNIPVPIFKIKDNNLRKRLTTINITEGIRSIEELSKNSDRRVFLNSNGLAAINHYIDDPNGFYFIEAVYSIGKSEYEQVVDTVKTRLLEFLLDLDENWNPEQPPPGQEQVKNLISIHIYNNNQGEHMTSIFDQRGQNVNYQFNAAGSINISEVSNKQSFVTELDKLKHEIEKIKNANLVDIDIAIEAENHLLEAKKEAQKEKPAKGSMLDHIGKAKELFGDISAAVGLFKALIEVSKLIEDIF